MIVLNGKANVIIKDVDPCNLVEYVLANVLLDIINVLAKLLEGRKFELLLDIVVLARRQEPKQQIERDS